MFSFWGSQEPEAQSRPEDTFSQSSWFPSSAGSTPTSSRPSTPSSSSSSSFNFQTPLSASPVSPAEAARIINKLKDKSVEELWKLLSGTDAYSQFLHAFDQVKVQDSLWDKLRRETLQLMRENLEKEPRIAELQNQCRIIRTTELAAAQEKLSELERQMEETLAAYSPASLLQKLQDINNKTEEESEALHRQLLDREIDVPTFVQKYKKLRTAYHRRSLVQIAARTSADAPCTVNQHHQGNRWLTSS